MYLLVVRIADLPIPYVLSLTVSCSICSERCWCDPKTLAGVGSIPIVCMTCHKKGVVVDA
jgi:hypothetical protein